MKRGTRQCSRHGSESIQLKKGLRRADQRHSPPCVVVNDRTRRSLQTSTGQALKKQPEAANVCLQPNRAGARNRVGMGKKYHPSAMGAAWGVGRNFTAAPPAQSTVPEQGRKVRR